MSTEPHKGMRRKRGVKMVVGLAIVAVSVLFVTLGVVFGSITGLISKPFKKRKRLVLGLLGAAVLIGGGYAAVVWYAGMNENGSIYDTVTKSLEFPAESAVATDEFVVKENQPKAITLPSIGAEGIIQEVSVDTDKSVARPNNVHVAGWYDKSVKPGEIGLSIMTGYTRGKYSKGVFYDLARLKTGDVFYVTYGDGRIQNFSVASVKQIPIRELPTAIFTRDQGIDRQLNLFTSVSNYEKGTEPYNTRTLVVASAK